MKMDEYRAKRAEYIEKIEQIKAKTEQEGRKMNSNERLEVDSILRCIESLDAEPSRTPAKWPVGGEDKRATRPFESLGQQLAAVRDAGMPGGRTDERLFEVRASGLNENLGHEGGFLLQSDFASQIWRNVYDSSPILERLNRFQVSGNSLTLPALDESSRVDGSRHGGVQAFWSAEAGTATASQPAFRTNELKLNKLMTIIYTTEELLEDVGALGQFVSNVGTDEIRFKILDGVVNGNGAGKPLGVLNSACRVDVSKTTGQTADTITLANVLKMYSRLLVMNENAVAWVANRDCAEQLYSLSSDGSGANPVWMPPGGVSGKPYATLLGYPVHFIEQCNTVGSLGDLMIGDWSQYICAEKSGGIRAASSMHVRFLYDEMAFKFTYRFDGQPVLSSPVTPFKGTNTLSPFVALAARD
jgi:HK97 family phage major capsid protein